MIHDNYLSKHYNKSILFPLRFFFFLWSLSCISMILALGGIRLTNEIKT